MNHELLDFLFIEGWRPEITGTQAVFIKEVGPDEYVSVPLSPQVVFDQQAKPRAVLGLLESLMPFYLRADGASVH